MLVLIQAGRHYVHGQAHLVKRLAGAAAGGGSLQLGRISDRIPAKGGWRLLLTLSLPDNSDYMVGTYPDASAKLPGLTRSTA